jgi:hypothetical protein
MNYFIGCLNVSIPVQRAAGNKPGGLTHFFVIREGAAGGFTRPAGIRIAGEGRNFAFYFCLEVDFKKILPNSCILYHFVLI